MNNIDFLDVLGYSLDKVEEISNNLNSNYLSYPIRKSNGKLRWIDAPTDELKKLQTNILRRFLYKFSAHEAAVGFVSGIGVKDGAERHLQNNVILCLDISNFFGDIKTDKIYTLIHHLLMAASRKGWITFNQIDFARARNLLVELVSYKGRLPQGAPTSPALANLFSIKIDRKLQEIADDNDLVYTRYADDLTFSCIDKTFNIGSLIPSIEKVLTDLHFKVNTKKTRVMRPHKRMVVTGIVINDKLGIPKYKWRNFRAKLHNLIRDNVVITTKEYQQLIGYAEWIRNLNNERGTFFLTQIGKIKLQT